MPVITDTVTKSKTGVMPELAWQTVLYNYECHSFDEAIEQIMLAIKCTEQTASQYAMTAHNLGCVAVFKGTKEKCEQVADVLGSIGLNVKVMQ